MPTNIVSVTDGPQTTVSTLIGAPLMIPARIIELLANTDPTSTLLRNGGANNSSLVAYSESTPLYLGSDAEQIAEFSEIPVAAGQTGIPRIAYSTLRGLGVRVSKKMRDQNKIGLVNQQIIQLANTMQRARIRALRAAFDNPTIPAIAAGAAWDTVNGKPRRDFANAVEVIASATPYPTAAVDDDTFNFDADTAVLPASLAPVLMDSDSFLSVYKDSLAVESIAYTGKLPRDIIGLAALKVRGWDPTRVLVLERGTVGFYSDTRPLQSTGLYGEGNGPNGGPTESWRSDTTEERVVGVDQPLAACWITGVTS